MTAKALTYFSLQKRSNFKSLRETQGKKYARLRVISDQYLLPVFIWENTSQKNMYWHIVAYFAQLLFLNLLNYSKHFRPENSREFDMFLF